MLSHDTLFSDFMLVGILEIVAWAIEPWCKNEDRNIAVSKTVSIISMMSLPIYCQIGQYCHWHSDLPFAYQV